MPAVIKLAPPKVMPVAVDVVLNPAFVDAVMLNVYVAGVVDAAYKILEPFITTAAEADMAQLPTALIVTVAMLLACELITQFLWILEHDEEHRSSLLTLAKAR